MSVIRARTFPSLHVSPDISPDISFSRLLSYVLGLLGFRGMTGPVTSLLVARGYLGMFLKCPPAAKYALTSHYLGRQ
eukprot:scaffold114354_cov37-Attheya_sp.AAC.2